MYEDGNGRSPLATPALPYRCLRRRDNDPWGTRTERGRVPAEFRSRIVFLKVTANSPAIVHFAKERSFQPGNGKCSLIFNKESSPLPPFSRREETRSPRGSKFSERGKGTGTGWHHRRWRFSLFFLSSLLSVCLFVMERSGTFFIISGLWLRKELFSTSLSLGQS